MKRSALILFLLSIGLFLNACTLADDLSTIFKSDEEASALYVKKGQEALGNNAIDQAIDFFTSAIEREPGEAQTYYLRGSAYHERYSAAFTANDPTADWKDFLRAIDDFSTAITLDPNYVEAYVFRGKTYSGFQDKHDLALEDFNMAIALDPTMSTAYYNRAYLYELMGKIELALADYRYYLEISSDTYWREEAEKHIQSLSAPRPVPPPTQPNPQAP